MVVLLFAHDLREFRSSPIVFFLAREALRSVDEAIRRRFKLIPFTLTIPPEEREPDLFESSRRNGRASYRGCLMAARTGTSSASTLRGVTAPPLSVISVMDEEIRRHYAQARGER
jgi:putative DNA primase/helicase